MGFYWQTILCYGFYVSGSLDVDIPEDWLLKDNKGTIIFVPKTKYLVNTIDQIIEEDEVKKGYVEMKEVKRALKINEDYFSVDISDQIKLNELATHFKINTDNINIWIIEYCWSTLDNDCSLSLTKKLKVT